MSRIATTERIMNQLRKTGKPAMSAADLAESLDVSVKTVNNNLEKLNERDEIETTSIGNATAYYIPDSDLPTHQKPDHTCHRCGRESEERNDITKLDIDTYFYGTEIESGATDFYVLCRFCYSDLASWLFGDEGAMGIYPRAHSWDISISQLRQSRDNPEVVSKPGEPNEYLDDFKLTAYRIFEGMVDDRDETIHVDDLRENMREELSETETELGIEFLEDNGYFYRTIGQMELLPAK